MIKDLEVINSLKKRYEDLHPLIFQRSLEKSESTFELFDLLENIPNYPIFWDDSKKKWTKLLDFCFFDKAKQLIKKN